MLIARFRLCAASVLLPAFLAACVTATPGPQPQTNATDVSYGAYGPNQPTSGYSSTGTLAIATQDGMFGTTGEISVDDSGPFPDNSLSLDPSLDDLGTDPFLGDLDAESALLGDVALTGDDGSQNYFDTEVGAIVYFATDSSELSESARETLRRQAAWLQLHPTVEATIEGHTDERGTRQYNLALGERRASSVRGYLTALGIDGDRLRKISFGKERPAIPGSDESAWSQNRRAATVLDSLPSGVPSDLPASDLPSDDLLDAGTSLDLGPSTTYSTVDDPLLDPSLDALLGTPSDVPLDGDIPDNPVLENIETGT